MIYYDDDMKEPVECIDDMSRPPYITAQGDLFCVWCGERYDEPEEDEYDKEYEFYGDTEEKNALEIQSSKDQEKP
jgi:hypothetical protein